VAELPQTLLGELVELRRRVEQLERQVKRQTVDQRDTAGRLRVRIGRQDDGKYGTRIWSSAGALVFDDTAA